MECFLYDPASTELIKGAEELIPRWIDNPNTTIWVKFVGSVKDDERRLLEEHFHLHELALQDALNNRHPPKLEPFDDHTFLLFKALSHDSKDTDCSTIQMAMFVGDRFFVTRTSGPSPSMQRLARELEENTERIASGPDALCARLIRFFVERYLKILLLLEPELEDLEEGMLQSGDDDLAKLIGHKADLKKLRRIFLYHEQILDELRSKLFPGFTEERIHEVNDAFEHQERANSLCQLYYELASDLIDGFLSLSSHHLNQIMKVLTIITAIFVPLSFIAGLYGMNFENMPELHARYGYFVLLCVMVSIATALLFIFRKKNWI